MRILLAVAVLFTTPLVIAQEELPLQVVTVDDQTMSEYKSLVETIIKEQERIHKISFPNTLPTLSIQFGLPASIPATYDMEAKMLTINASYGHCDFVYLKEHIREPNFERTDCHYQAIRQSISHVLGYFYLQTILERQVPDSWLVDTLRSGMLGIYDFDQLSNLMVIKGIAETFEDTFGDRNQAKVSPGFWWTPETADEPRAYAYSYGELLDPDGILSKWLLEKGVIDIVRPVLEAQGYDAGVQWLLKNRLDIAFKGHHPNDYIDWSPVLEYRSKGVAGALPHNSS